LFSSKTGATVNANLKSPSGDFLNKGYMKTILVDAIHAFVTETGINNEMYKILEEFPNPKILLTGASGEMFEKYGLDKMPYEVFTLKKNPPKSDPEYFKILLNYLKKGAEEVVYFEHNKSAIQSAESIGIKTYYYDEKTQDVPALKEFLLSNI
jgi:HAD superfamily hydrolase (TIGR01509 family)